MELHRAHARLERAKMHQREFAQIWNGFLTGGKDASVNDACVVEAAAMEHEPYVTSVTVDTNGEGVIRVEPVDFPAEALALELGEMLYQIRAALDSLIYDTAIGVTGQDPPPNAEELEFPIRPSEASFNNASRKIGPLTDQQKAWIEDIQPYRAEYVTDGMKLTAKALDEINDLARKDRHRGLHVVASWGSSRNPQLKLPPGCSLEWMKVADDGLLERESEIARFKIRNWSRGLELHANPNLFIDVTVEDAAPPVSDDDTLFYRTRTWLAVVTLLIEGFEDSLAGDPRRN